MSSSKKSSKFDIWWNGADIKRFTGAAYSLGAAIVILGALFKIQHWPGAGIMLSIGMCTEALLFALGVFDRPYKEYDWDKVFAFDGKSKSNASSGASGSTESPAKLADSEMKNLSDNIRSLSETAKQLTSLGDVMESTKSFAKNIDSASNAATEFTTAQATLNKATGSLFTSYESLNTNMNTVVGNTTQYAAKVGEINKNLSSINSIYELQLKNIKEQSDAVAQQTKHTAKASESLTELVADNQKILAATKSTVEEVNKIKSNSVQLAGQIAELNKVYGNMLNALN